MLTGKHLQILSNAASGYHKVLEDNRKLYNQIQDLKGTIVGAEGIRYEGY
jgi:kinesin family protein C2/C3